MVLHALTFLFFIRNYYEYEKRFREHISGLSVEWSIYLSYSRTLGKNLNEKNDILKYYYINYFYHRSCIYLFVLITPRICSNPGFTDTFCSGARQMS